MTQYRRQLGISECCNNWKNGIRTIDGQYPDDNREFNIAAGDGIKINPITAGIEIAVKAPLPGPMVFRGTVGTSGTIATLPDANVDNIGWTYVAISAGTTPDDTPKSYDIGDTLVSNGEEWIVIPSGDDPVDWSQITGTPTTLSGYGITDAVTLNTEQTITERKIFARTGTGFSDTRLKGNRTTGNICGLHGYDGNDTLKGQVNFADDGVKIAFANNTPALVAFNDHSASAVRTYNASNTNDIVTIGLLQASSDVVHRTGNEIITGVKTFQGGNFEGIRMKNPGFSPRNTQSSSYHATELQICGSDDLPIFVFRFQEENNGTRIASLGIWNHNSNDYTFFNLGSVSW